MTKDTYRRIYLGLWFQKNKSPSSMEIDKEGIRRVGAGDRRDLGGENKGEAMTRM